MKLDNIIYDVDTLGTAIQSDLINESTTFNAMYPSQTSTELVNVLAGYGSMLQYNMVSALANCYTDTAYSPTGIYQLAETLGNQLHGNISSQLTCNIKRINKGDLQTVSIPAGSIFNVEGLEFFNKEDIIFSSSSSSNLATDVTLIQGTKNVTERISSGIGGERFYFADDFECNTNMVTVTVEGEDWDIVDSFLPLNMNMLIDPDQAKAFVLRTDPDGRSYLKAGSGANAKIPPSGNSIKITWISNKGSKGNITKSNASISLVTPIYYVTTSGQRIQLEVEITDSTPATGGFDTQDLMTLKESSPYVFASGNRAVRRNDYKAILLNKCGYQTCNVWGEYEQAAIEGTYNKIMMNMVYYSGIKTFQKYELQSLAPALDFDIDSLNFYEVEKSSDTSIMKKWYHEVNGDLTSIRGFLGSYEVELIGYDNVNSKKSLIYSDKYGTGILTLNYTDNEDIINKPDYVNYMIDDIGPDFAGPGNDNRIYDYNDIPDIRIYNQDESFGYVIKEDLFDTGSGKSPAYAENTDACYKFSGKFAGQDVLLSPVNPIQILLEFPSGRKINNLPVTENDLPTDADPTIPLTEYEKQVDNAVISAIAFKTPKNADLLKKFIGSFAIYGSNNPVLDITTVGTVSTIANVKNNSKWTKLTDTITINQDLTTEQWTDWFTLNTYNPDNNIWTEYQYYLIEIYSFYDQISIDSNPGDQLVIGEIKAVYGDQTVNTVYVGPNHESSINMFSKILPGRSSYIYYNNNNFTALRIPYDHKSSGTNDLLIPDNFQFYRYSVKIEGAVEDNNYNAGDEFTYTDKGVTFHIRITNNLKEDGWIVSLYPDFSNSVLNGQRYIEANKVLLDPSDPRVTTTSSGSGATITITSESCIDLYSNFVGNFYTDTDIQKLDLPTIEKYNHFTTYLEFKQPKIKNIFVDISVEYENVTTVNDVKNNIINTINELFEITPFSLGKTFSVSDLWKTVAMVEGVKRLIVNNPTTNITAQPYELIALPATNLTIRDISDYTTRIKD